MELVHCPGLMAFLYTVQVSWNWYTVQFHGIVTLSRSYGIGTLSRFHGTVILSRSYGIGTLCSLMALVHCPDLMALVHCPGFMELLYCPGIMALVHCPGLNS